MLQRPGQMLIENRIQVIIIGPQVPIQMRRQWSVTGNKSRLYELLRRSLSIMCTYDLLGEYCSLVPKTSPVSRRR